MDKRITLKEVRTFIRNVAKDYRSGTGPSKKDKRKAIWRTIWLLWLYIWNGISAPIFYPIWYIFRKPITKRVYKGTSWQEIVGMIDLNQTRDVKNKLRANGKLMYWLWTFGDLRDPLGLGEIVGYGVRNTFWNRYKENAFRNARFTINFMKFRSGNVTEVYTSIDNRNYNFMHKSQGIGDSPDGIVFKWFKDDTNRWIFIYEDNNENAIFYYGFVGLLKKGIGANGRFEVAYRPCGSSYHKP